jgi:YD repeat-containing protein
MGGTSFAESFGYDADGNLGWVRNPANEQTDFSYDANGNLTRNTDAAGNVTERAYDSANRLVNETRYTTADPDGVAGAGTAS